MSYLYLPLIRKWMWIEAGILLSKQVSSGEGGPIQGKEPEETGSDRHDVTHLVF